MVNMIPLSPNGCLFSILNLDVVLEKALMENIFGIAKKKRVELGYRKLLKVVEKVNSRNCNTSLMASLLAVRVAESMQKEVTCKRGEVDTLQSKYVHCGGGGGIE